MLVNPESVHIRLAVYAGCRILLDFQCPPLGVLPFLSKTITIAVCPTFSYNTSHGAGLGIDVLPFRPQRCYASSFNIGSSIPVCRVALLEDHARFYAVLQSNLCGVCQPLLVLRLVIHTM
jgi:hypothetical protein